MNSVKLKDIRLIYRHVSLFYIIILMNYSTENFFFKSCLKSQEEEHLGINLTKEEKDLYSENYKTLV